MRPGVRRLALICAAVLAGVLPWYAPPPGGEQDVLPSARDRAAANAGRRTDPRFSALPERAALSELRREMFAAPAALAPAESAAVAPTPAVPPNPYSVAGTLVQDGAASVFLVKGDRIYEAKAGIELEGGYRVESIAADHVVLLYLPLGAKQSLPYRSSLVAETAAAPATALPASPPAAEAAAPAAAARAAQLRWQGPDSVRAGATFSVALHVSSDQQLRATPMQLRFEPELLEALAVRAGKFFGQGSFSYRMNPDGTIFVGAAGRGAAPGADAELVVLTFRSRRAGATAQVSLGSVALQDPAGRALAHDAVANFRTAIQ